MSKILDAGRIQGNFYGGLPYDASWNFNDGNSPSTLKISVVNAQGQYPNLDQELSYSKSVSIKLGNFTFQGHLVSYEIDRTPQQKLLHLNYVDMSVALEQYYVGLYKRHGGSGSNAKNLIVVGKEYHPCDKNKDSTVSNLETAPVIDPCDPCPYMPTDKYKGSCDPVRTDFQIWEVFYTFNDLISKLPLATELSSGAAKDSNYKAQHTGSLKSVLGAWCSDLGLAYYWDPFSSKLVFVDRSKPLEVPSSLESTPDIIEYKSGASKQNTFARGFIGYFGKQGEIKEYTCTLDPTNSFQTLQPLTIADLYNQDNYPRQGEIAAKEICSVFSRYGKPLRDAYLWYGFYKLNTAKDTENVTYANRPGGSSGGSPDNILNQFGGMKILGVYSQTAQKPENQAAYASLGQFIKIDKNDPTEKTNPTYYFLADVNDEVVSTQFQSEQNIAQNFLGRYWYKPYNTLIPGADNAHTQIQAEAPDGAQVQWYTARKDVSAIPIFGFGHEEGSAVSKLYTKIQNDAQANQNPYTNSAAGASNGKAAVSAFLLMDRASKFSPNESESKYYQSLFDWYEQYVPSPVVGLDNSVLSSLPGYDASFKNLKLFKVREYGDFKADIHSASNPLEPTSMTMKTKTTQNAIGTPVVTSIGQYGLVSNQSAQIRVGSSQKVDMVIYTPPQSIQALFGGDSGSNTSAAGYKVYVQPSATFPKIIPKVQYTYSADAASADVAKLDYNYKEIQEDNINLINGQKCVISDSSIKDYVKGIGQKCSYSQVNPLKTVTMKVPGVVPYTFSVAQAINSIQINITENGSFTTYSFEDKVIQPPSDDYITQQYLLDKSKPQKSVGGNSITAAEITNIKAGMGR